MQSLTKNLFGISDGFSDIGNPAPADPWGGWAFVDPFNATGPAPEETAAEGDLGTITSLARGGQTSSSGTAAASSSAPTVVTTPGSGLVIDLA